MDVRALNLVAAMRGTPHPRVLQALNTMAEGEGWPSLGEGPVVGLNIPEPVALARERSVRVEWHDEVLLGTVAEDEGDQVTVRLRRENGVIFPTLARHRVEPIAASGEEALHQGFAALRAGDRKLAWLWLCRAHVLGGAPVELLRQLGRLVSGGYIERIRVRPQRGLRAVG